MNTIRILIAACAVSTLNLAAQANPQEHLAPTPQPSKVEAEVIGLLQLSSPRIDPSGNITLALYNPTRYVLKGCVIKAQVSSRGIDRIYNSDAADISPLRDGEFLIRTRMTNVPEKELKVEILKLTYDPPKK